jgi:hypothetical protein
MKLSDLRSCDICKGKLMQLPQSRPFYVFKLTRCLLDPTKTNQVLGLTQTFQGHLGLAEAMAPSDDPVTEIPSPATVLVCIDCAFDATITRLMEAIGDRELALEKETDSHG